MGKEGILINLANLEEECHVPSMAGYACVFTVLLGRNLDVMFLSTTMASNEGVDMKVNCMFSI